ncbi:hypothetical protein [Blastococcus sp. SYSU D00813]
MTAVLPADRPTAAPAPLESVVPAAPASRPVPTEPAGRWPRYWDHEAAAWRPCPVLDGC